MSAIMKKVHLCDRCGREIQEANRRFMEAVLDQTDPDDSLDELRGPAITYREESPVCTIAGCEENGVGVRIKGSRFSVEKAGPVLEICANCAGDFAFEWDANAKDDECRGKNPWKHQIEYVALGGGKQE